MTITLQGFIKTIGAVLWFSSLTWLPLLMIAYDERKGAFLSWFFGVILVFSWVVLHWDDNPSITIGRKKPKLPKAKVRQ